MFSTAFSAHIRSVSDFKRFKFVTQEIQHKIMNSIIYIIGAVVVVVVVLKLLGLF
jgi:protein-S-isoprenylcysteine O-methyltransferase Ste14